MVRCDTLAKGCAASYGSVWFVRSVWAMISNDPHLDAGAAQMRLSCGSRNRQ